MYRLAKELQHLDSARFDNIFLSLGGCHKKKVVIAYCGKYVADTGINSILVENEVYVMNEGHYVRGIRGMAIVSEFLLSLLLNQFLIEIDENTQNLVVQQVKSISQLISETNNQSTNTE